MVCLVNFLSKIVYLFRALRCNSVCEKFCQRSYIFAFVYARHVVDACTHLSDAIDLAIRL